MPGLIGKKIGMTSVFNGAGKNIACTVIEVKPNVVSQIKTVEKDGYNAVQLSYDDKKEKHSNKAEAGHFKKANTGPKKKVIELKGFVRDWKVGDRITVEYFSDDTWLDISGFTKGKGFREWSSVTDSEGLAIKPTDSTTGTGPPDRWVLLPILPGC